MKAEDVIIDLGFVCIVVASWMLHIALGIFALGIFLVIHGMGLYYQRKDKENEQKNTPKT